MRYVKVRTGDNSPLEGRVGKVIQETGGWVWIDFGFKIPGYTHDAGGRLPGDTGRWYLTYWVEEVPPPICDLLKQYYEKAQ